MVRVEDEPCLALPVLATDPSKPDLPDHLANLAPHHGIRQPVTFIVKRGLMTLPIQGLPDFRAVPGIPVQVPRHVWARLICVQVIEVAAGERAQGQPGRLKGMSGEQHRLMVAEPPGSAYIPGIIL
jgi:hypothetical protein